MTSVTLDASLTEETYSRRQQKVK